MLATKQTISSHAPNNIAFSPTTTRHVRKVKSKQNSSPENQLPVSLLRV